ncbi:hypothetical protein ACQ4P5_20340 [Ralstonia sp. L16]|uniref:hypothetical protein n=1 Tax=Ralstonia sp. L16 TaxID=3423950 RepID=UPI003F79ED34
MRYSERLLEELAADTEDRRKGIERYSTDIDSLGEILSTAHYAGVTWDLCDVRSRDTRLLLWCPDELKLALHSFLVANGATETRTIEHEGSLHRTLQLPNVQVPVVLVTPLTLGAASHP